jgi:hypothetical protein
MEREPIFTLTRVMPLLPYKSMGPFTKRSLLTSGGKEIKNSQQTLQFLKAVWKPLAIAVIHCLAHTN